MEKEIVNLKSVCIIIFHTEDWIILWCYLYTSRWENNNSNCMWLMNWTNSMLSNLLMRWIIRFLFRVKIFWLLIAALISCMLFCSTPSILKERLFWLVLTLIMLILLRILKISILVWNKFTVSMLIFPDMLLKCSKNRQ